MKKQLLIIGNTLILAFGLSSCGKKDNNLTGLKRSLNLNVVKASLEPIKPQMSGHMNLLNGYWEDKLFLTEDKNEDTSGQTIMRTGITVYGDQPFEQKIITTIHENVNRIKGFFQRENIQSHYSETTQPIMSIKEGQALKIQLTSWSHLKWHNESNISYPMYPTWPNWKKYSPKNYKEDGILLKIAIFIKKSGDHYFFKRTAIFGQLNRDKLIDYDCYLDNHWGNWISGEENYELFTVEMPNNQFFKPGIKIINDGIYLTLSYDINEPENNVAYYPLHMSKTDLISRWDNIDTDKWI